MKQSLTQEQIAILERFEKKIQPDPEQEALSAELNAQFDLDELIGE